MLADGLNGLAACRDVEGRSQAGMAFDDGLNGGSQQPDVERALDPDRAVDDPQRLLAVRQRKTARLTRDLFVEKLRQQGAPMLRRLSRQRELPIAHGRLSPDASN